MSIKGETTTCTTCGLDLVYNDTGYWPWRAIDGTEMCAGHAAANVRWPHEATPQDTQEIFAAFRQRTGRRAAHQRPEAESNA
jgi:hypothetical protein